MMHDMMMGSGMMWATAWCGSWSFRSLASGSRNFPPIKLAEIQIAAVCS
jgi:hypothetical protein